MAKEYQNVIVFGPTGGVGGAAALEASKRGAKVWLAMRDPSKAVRGVSEEQVQEGKFARIKADLSDPETVKKAIQSSEAKAAFVYLVHAPGGTRNAVQAMKDAGVEYIVFLSSYTIAPEDDIRKVKPEAVIPYIHAQAEVALEDIGIDHTALRPGWFAGNQFWEISKSSSSSCEIRIFDEGKHMRTNIVPQDIGRIGGAVLVNRPSSGPKEIIYVQGPKMISEYESACILQSAFAQHSIEAKIVPETEEEYAERSKKSGSSAAMTQYQIDARRGRTAKDTESSTREGSANITKYSGHQPTSFETFVQTRTASGKL